jgi:hypothetical protein
LFPFALVDLIIVGYVTVLMAAFGRTVPDLLHRRRSVANAVMSGGLRMARDLGVIVALFYVVWGFNYAREPLSERLDWPQWSPPQVEELVRAAADAVAEANDAYWDIHHSEDAGEPTPMPADLAELESALEQGWNRSAELLNLGGSAGKRYGRTKRLLLSPIVARFGISGFYFPWTAEANVLADLPAVGRPHSMAHEKAHQRGTGPENEASFLGFLAGALASHPHARYAAYTFAQGQILGALARVDREAYREIVSRRFPGIQRDLDDYATYWNKYRGISRTIGRTVNNRYLRANRVEGGVLSYGLTVRLLLTFAKQNDGRIAPDR